MSLRLTKSPPSYLPPVTQTSEINTTMKNKNLLSFVPLGNLAQSLLVLFPNAVLYQKGLKYLPSLTRRTDWRRRFSLKVLRFLTYMDRWFPWPFLCLCIDCRSQPLFCNWVDSLPLFLHGGEVPSALIFSSAVDGGYIYWNALVSVF